jgi:release factor glutamine methyltransferase
MEISQLITAIAQQLAQRHPHDIVTRQQDAWWILEAITQKTEAQILAQKDFVLTRQQEIELEKWIDLHVNHAAPIQYLIGWVPFDDVQIFTRPPVLIPRPETEEWVIKLTEKLRAIKTPLNILDIGAGSGCISISLAKALPHSKIYAVDISDEALQLIKENVAHNRVQNMYVLKSDLFAQLPKMHFDLIVSNPPYIAPEEWHTLAPSVTKWEDKRALLGGKQGLEIINQIIEQTKIWLKQNGLMQQNNIPQLVLEIGYQQGAAVKKLCIDAGYTDVTIEKDLEGKDRVIYARI